MSKNHDENKDLRLISRIGKINYSAKTIAIKKGVLVGIRTLGRLDYLKHCGWWIYKSSDSFVPSTQDDNYSTALPRRKEVDKIKPKKAKLLKMR